jgi:glycerophosphoryl diester phosphodiesterase
VGINLEIKYDALDASRLTSREAFVAKVVDALRIDGLVGRTSIQCFDWGVLHRVGEAEPALARNLLVSPKYLRDADGAPSPWFDGLAVDDDFVVTAARQGFTAISPIHGSPFRSGVDDPAYRPFATEALVEEAHGAGLAVIPYVVDDAPTMRHLVRTGVDGLITNHPERLREVLAAEGRELPHSFPG